MKPEINTTANANRIWRELRRPRGTPAQRYIDTRGFANAIGEWLGFHPACPRYNGERGEPVAPAAIAAVTNPVTGEFLAIHRIFLKHDGSGKADLPRGEQKKSLGRTSGGAVVIGDLRGTDASIVEGEGIETTASACVALRLPGVATLNVGTLGRPPLPPGRSVIMLADRGTEDIAERAAQSRFAEGREVWLALPPLPHKDWNDMLMADCVEVVRGELAKARQITIPPPTLPAPRRAASIVTDATKLNACERERMEKHAKDAIEHEAKRLAELKSGRCDALFRVVCRIGKYPARGVYGHADIERLLIDACTVNGTLAKRGRRYVLSVIRNGFAISANDALPVLAPLRRRSARS